MYYGEIKDCDIANGTGSEFRCLSQAVQIIARTVFNHRPGRLTMEVPLMNQLKIS